MLVWTHRSSTYTLLPHSNLVKLIGDLPTLWTDDFPWRRSHPMALPRCNVPATAASAWSPRRRTWRTTRGARASRWGWSSRCISSWRKPRDKPERRLIGYGGWGEDGKGGGGGWMMGEMGCIDIFWSASGLGDRIIYIYIGFHMISLRVWTRF